ncbi:MAG: hypothetical protein IRY88_12305 [Rubrobacteraceae bacterium]|nr:hypothetical protein [Rubrobacteraceae bacterium]
MFGRTLAAAPDAEEAALLTEATLEEALVLAEAVLVEGAELLMELMMFCTWLTLMLQV